MRQIRVSPILSKNSNLSYSVRRMFLDTQKITHEIRMKHWMQIIAQRQQSGLTVKGFCAQQDILIKQYYYYTFLKSCRIQQTSKMPKP